MYSVSDWLAFAVWEEGRPSPEDVDPDEIPLLGFARTHDGAVRRPRSGR
ncbi:MULTISPECIES: hypothetical protein [unclassified Streptomyces]|nr:hypothetical protein [Streptomyces sp. SID2563]